MKLSDKQYQALWDDFAESIANSISVDLNETPEQQRQRITRLETPGNEELWFKHYFPEDGSSEPAPFHIAATQRIVNNPEWYEVRMWSRELAKTTRTMMEVLYLMLTKKKKYALMCSNSYDNAETLLMGYKGHLELNPRIIHDYGVQERPGKWEAGKFTSRMGFAFRAVGAGQNPRGTKNKHVRPDVLLFDDIDDDEVCRNPSMINKVWNWIDKAVIGTRSISAPTLIIFCGNRIAIDCCVVRAAAFAKKVDEVNIRDDQGKSTWSKNTEEMIDNVLKQRSYAAVQQEYYNNPIVEGSRFPKMHYKPARLLKDYSFLVCYTDPSFKEGKKNDYKATVLVGKWKDEYHVLLAFVAQTTTAQMIQWHFEVMKYVQGRSCYYLMEEVFLQDLIISEFHKMSRLRGLTIPLVGDKRDKDDKFTRIDALLEPLHRNGQLFLNEDEKDSPGMKVLDQQFVAFAAGSRAHDDGPDAVEGAVWYAQNKEITKMAGNATVIRRNYERNEKKF